MKKPHPKRRAFIGLIVLLLAILLLALWYFLNQSRSPAIVETAKPMIVPVVVDVDTVAQMPAEVETAIRKEPEPEPEPQPRQPRRTQPPVDSAPRVMADTVEAVAVIEPQECDTTELWVYPDPSGGLHRGEVAVRFQASKPCTILWRFLGDEQWRRYESEQITIPSTVRLQFSAVDTCGNRMAQREEIYEIHATTASRFCPSDMEYVEVGERRFCIDRYEWPNRKGQTPLSFVSLYQAMDSCYSVDKRLCTTEEWTTACAGPQGSRYPYGQHYEPRACWTGDTTVRRSGSRRECRGYFDVYDMSGNLAEWTSTRSSKNPQFFNVMGGFWESGMHSGCNDIRYSYYPQNRHNPVGFRCCRDAAPDQGKK